MKKSVVSLIKAKNIVYPPKEIQYRPSYEYPELKELNLDISKMDNDVYDAVREGFHLMEFDKENYGTKYWNPLGHIINPGDNVLIKPNLVMHINRLKKRVRNACIHKLVLWLLSSIMLFLH